MSVKLGNHLDLGLNQIQNVLGEILGSDPGSPPEGRFWYRSDIHAYRYKDNAAIQQLGVLTTPLSAFGVPIAAVSFNSQKITNLADPTGAQDAATKNYVDITVQGLQQKPSARVATAAALPANTYANGTAGVGATLTANANGALTVDGVAVAVNDLVLVKNEAASANNGLYTVTAAGGAGAVYVLTRHADMDQTGEFAGAFIAVETGGTANSNTLWLASNTASVTVGTTAVTFTQLNAATTLSGSSSITISAGVISINATWVGQTSITTLGTITTGVWNGTTIAVANGGTGATTAATARDSTHLGTQTAPAAATNVTVAAAGIPTKVTATLTGTGAATSFTITHNIGSQDVIVLIRDGTTNAQVLTDVVMTDANTVTITFATAPANAATYKVTVIG